MLVFDQVQEPLCTALTLERIDRERYATVMHTRGCKIYVQKVLSK